MKRVLIAIVLCFVAIWYALLDRCLITASGMPMSSDIYLLLLLQVCAGAFLLKLFVGGFLTMSGFRNLTIKVVVFIVPALFFFVSPVIISEVLNREHYGIDKFVVDAHIGQDLSCCVNPLSTPSPGKR